MRTSDRQRAKERRTHQHGETYEQYQVRLTATLEAATGLKVRISRDSPYSPYVIQGYTPRGEALSEPLIRVARLSLAAAASAFDHAAAKLREADADSEYRTKEDRKPQV